MQNLHNEKKNIACAILAGGKNQRMGRHKAFLDFRGRRFVEVIRDNMRAWFGEIFIVTNNKEPFLKFSQPVFEDLLPDRGPLGALYTALSVSRKEYVFCVACDMPNAYDRVIARIIWTNKRRDFDCFIPRGPSGPEPLFALYHTRLRDLCEREIESGQLSIAKMLNKCRTCYIGLAKDEAGLVNINTPKEYRRYAHQIEGLAGKKR